MPDDLSPTPCAASGTTLVEAIHLGRDCPRRRVRAPLGRHRRANIAHARRQGATGTGQVIGATPASSQP